MPVSATVKIFIIALYTSIPGLLYGLDTGSIGPIIQMVQFRNSVGHLTSTAQGFYVASILFSASLSSFSSGYVADRISRKYGILAGSLLIIIGTAISSSANNFTALFCARLITGMGQGQSISVVTVYLCEIAPQNIRGTLACMIQLLITIGITTGYFITYATANIHGSLAWRVPFMVQACIAAILASGMAFIPYSPRWLVQHGRIDEARQTLQKLRNTDSVETELQSIQNCLELSPDEKIASYAEMFQKRYLKRTLLSIFLMSFQQLTGIDAVRYYAPILFTHAGFTSERAAFLASGVAGIMLVAFTIPAQVWVDKWGRKFPLVVGGLTMVVCLMGVGTLYACYRGKANGVIYLDGKGAQWAAIILIYLFVSNFSWSWAVVANIYACEIVPTKLRAKACATQQLSNCLVNFVFALMSPVFLRASPSGPYFFFGSTTLFAVIICSFFVPETKGKSLEEIEGLFEPKPRYHIEKI